MASHSAGISSGASLLYIHRSYSPQVCRQMSRESSDRRQTDALYAAACSGRNLTRSLLLMYFVITYLFILAFVN